MHLASHETRTLDCTSLTWSAATGGALSVEAKEADCATKVTDLSAHIVDGIDPIRGRRVEWWHRTAAIHAESLATAPRTQLWLLDLLIGKWTIKIRPFGRPEPWTWEYGFHPDGRVTWQDLKSAEKGSGNWAASAKLVNIGWNDSATRESWTRPLAPTPPLRSRPIILIGSRILPMTHIGSSGPSRSTFRISKCPPCTLGRGTTFF